MARTRFLNRLRFILDRSLTVANALDKASAAHPQRVLFHLDEVPAHGALDAAISASDLLRFACRFGTLLTGQLGLSRWDRVAIMKGNHGDIVLMGLAAMRAGLITVPINGGMDAGVAARYLEYTGARCLVTDTQTLERLIAGGGVPDRVEHVLVTDAPPGDARSRDPRARGLLEAITTVPRDAWLAPADLEPDDDVLICHTSGTTGIPKGVLHTSGSLVAGLKGQLEIEPVFSGDRVVSASPFNHFINHLGLLASLTVGVPVWLWGSDEPGGILDLIDRERITVTFCFPHTYLAMLEQGLDGRDLGSVRLWLAGADSSHEAHIQPFVQRGAFLRIGGRRVIPSIYADTLGSSEVGFAALFRFVSRRSRVFGRFAGKPTFAGPKVRIADESGRSVPDGQVGRLMVKGPTLFKGYWNAHDKLHGVVRDGWWWTGDVGLRDASGNFFHYDRDVDVIHAAHGPVYSLPLEEELLKHEDVMEAVVIGVPDGRGHHAPIALLQPRPGRELEPRALLAWSRGRLDDGQHLARVLIADAGQIPRGLTGKVLKRVLRERYEELLKSGAEVPLIRPRSRLPAHGAATPLQARTEARHDAI